MQRVGVLDIVLVVAVKLAVDLREELLQQLLFALILLLEHVGQGLLDRGQVLLALVQIINQHIALVILVVLHVDVALYLKGRDKIACEIVEQGLAIGGGLVVDPLDEGFDQHQVELAHVPQDYHQVLVDLSLVVEFQHDVPEHFLLDLLAHRPKLIYDADRQVNEGQQLVQPL